ncbi:MAG: tetratricopeptide repeat protein, partial [Chloroflexota bacterium]
SKTEILWKKGAISESLVESCFAIYYQQPALISLIFVGLVCFTLFVVVDIHFKHEPFKWLIVNASFAASSAIFWILGFQKPLNKKNQSNIVSKLLAPAVLMRLNAFLVVGKRSEAISLAEKATVWKVKSKDIFSILGVSYFEENKYGPAAGAFSEVLKLKKDDVLAHFGLGRIFLETGEIGNADEAILHFQKAASSLFEVAAWLWTGNLYWNYRHDLRGALVTWEKAVNKDPRYVIKMTEPGIKDTRLIRMPEEHFKLGLAYERIGEKENAVKAFELASILGAYPNLNDEARRRLKRLKSKVT